MVDGKKARELNAVFRYTAWSVFRLARSVGDVDRPRLADEVAELFEQLAAKDVTVRGTYDVSALRADADLMVWWHAPTAEALQDAYSRLRRTSLGQHLDPVWSVWRYTDRPSSTAATSPPFWPRRNRGATCAYTRSCGPTSGTCCPRWNGARSWPSTVSWPASTRTCGRTPSPSFALGDYEWILAFEADDLHRIVDLMRHLRSSETRRHVREEVPFYTGTRRSVAEIVSVLP